MKTKCNSAFGREVERKKRAALRTRRAREAARLAKASEARLCAFSRLLNKYELGGNKTMKTSKILAASIAALLGCGAVAVVAHATPGDPIDGKTYKISFDAGTTYEVVGGKVEGDTAGTEADFDQETITEANLSGTYDSDLKISISLKDAKKLKGVYEVTGSISSIDEDDYENVDKESIESLNLDKDVLGKLTKTKAADVKLINVKVGKDGKVVSGIGKPLTVTLSNTFNGAKVYHVNSDGTVTKIDSHTAQALSDDSYETSFSTSSFSSFIITTAELKSTAGANANASDSSAASNATVPGNPNTGVALAIAPVVLAATAVSVVALKKKH